MKLEDLTKAELIDFIRRNEFRHGVSESQIVSDAIYHRLIDLSEKRMAVSKENAKYTAEYSELLKPYDGNPIASIPEEIIHKGAKLERKMKELWEKEKRLEREYQKLNREWLQQPAEED